MDRHARPGRARSTIRDDTSGHDDDALEYYPGGDVMLHGVVRGSPAGVREKIRCLERAAIEAGELHPGYFPIPGPNSNTYVDILLRRCAIGVELPATAIGRDYRGIVGASVTESRTGIQIESIPLGLRLGLLDGIELHLFGLAFGLHCWPPGIKTWTYERGGYAGSGWFIALERRELMGSAWLGFSLGIETDAAW